ncbi:NADH-FMN oxidoreductase RutF, flavin reductase (DIM6/NTAB) family [Actinopolyspora mzabensis]|uniref:NADH-FMN oxidoreductase RutF, flavin reductase (DIM6/NTAB) family n=1 Tax=Actinopolyspora mzabensis TaxID=995066 RepID=A0A1G8Y6J9_ACTMZ|nr:flavin reductase family protein [Actinopolyspora mzabensis]SDJ98353.1 NADH-FMN oxidoreductase RutF, flavin reductase (DIM6/NTAB) family [Actinopolyspora mzabensis]
MFSENHAPTGRDVRITPTSPHPRSRDDPTSLRAVMSRFATGVTVLTAGGSRAHGMTANSFNSVSLDPPLVLCCVSRTARMHASIAASCSFGVSVLADDQRELARYFADRTRPAGWRQFEGVGWKDGPFTGAPLLDGSLAWLECELADVHEAGDHSIFLGSVLGSGCGADSGALLFCGGDYYDIKTKRREEKR